VEWKNTMAATKINSGVGVNMSIEPRHEETAHME
jgi:hypothetical protein